MSIRAGAARTADDPPFEPFPVNVRIKISALWTAMLFVFAYVDIFSLYRPDVRADLEAGTLAGFTVNEPFLLGTTTYIVIPALMVVGALVLRPRVNRIANIVLGIVYAFTIIAGAAGEWSYYVFGSAIEVGLLAAIVYLAWTWPRIDRSRAVKRVAEPGSLGHDASERRASAPSPTGTRRAST